MTYKIILEDCHYDNEEQNLHVFYLSKSKAGLTHTKYCTCFKIYRYFRLCYATKTYMKLNALIYRQFH